MTVPLLSLSKEQQLMIFMKMDIQQMIKICQACNSTKKFVERNGRQLATRRLHSRDGAKIKLTVNKHAVVLKSYNLKKNLYGFKEFKLDVSEEAEHFYKRFTAISVDTLEITFRMNVSNMIPNLLAIIKEWKPICRDFYVNGTVTVEIVNILKFLTVYGKLYLTFPSDDDKAITALKECPYNHCMSVLCYRVDDYHENCRYFREFKTSPHSEDSLPKLLRDLANAANADEIGNLKEAEFTFNLVLSFNNLTMKGLFPEIPFPQTVKLYSDDDKLFIEKLPLADGKYAIITDKNIDLQYGPQRQKLVTIKIMDENEQEQLNLLLREIGIHWYPQESKAKYFAMDDNERAEELDKFKKRQDRKQKAAN